MSQEMDIICFEKAYQDQPEDIEFSVRYDNKPYLHNKEIIGVLTITHLDDISIPITELPWLISCLERIRDERRMK